MDKLQKMREIIKVLPKFNCGFCGFGNCGNYARAVVEGNAPPNRCLGGPLVTQRICAITGAKMPVSREQELWLLRQRQMGLSQQVEALARRVEALAARSGR
jgi:Na+-translocating ferredoxin:NAD+ oxidoreductase RNF subunit RnfB